jgi:hypothetical protein
MAKSLLKGYYSTHTMSEINKRIPETVTQQAKAIDFKAARGKRFERTQKQALTGVDRSRTAFTPISTEVPTEANQPPQNGKRVELSSSAGKTGEIRPLAENTHTVIDFQKARENRLVGCTMVLLRHPCAGANLILLSFLLPYILIKR